MGIHKGTKKSSYTTEFKLKVVKMRLEDNLPLKEICEKEGITSIGMIANWCRMYTLKGIDGLKPKHHFNPYAGIYNKKPKTYVEGIELENLKLRIENERLKKGYQVKGGGANKEYVSILEENMKSLRH